MSPVIAHSVLEDIRLGNSIETVIGSYFNLKRSGSSFVALCPFHKEKTPSFHVNPQRQIFHCFGCAKGGDVFRFVMDYEKVDFMTAVKMLARRAGIQLVFDEGQAQAQRSKEALYELNAKVADFYHQLLLKSPQAEKARGYLKQRLLSDKAVEQFLIGYAPDRWDGVLQWAGKKHTTEQLEAVGLVLQSQRAGNQGRQSYYDRFRNRLMFPIRDEQGRVVGFSGRVFTDSKEAAKYVNSPETTLFHKGRVLYDLYLARRAIVDAREAVICEGQIDVIRCHLNGFTNTIAALGTAFTENHARILKRYADSVLLIFDADRAGQDAALRAAETFLQVGLAMRFVALPAGQDPDSMLCGKDGVAVFNRLIDEAKTMIDFQIDVLASREALDTEVGLMRVARSVVELIRKTPNAVQQARLIQQAANRLSLSQEVLRKELHNLDRRAPARADPQKPEPAGPVRRPINEMSLAELLVSDPALTEIVKKYLPLELVTDHLCRQVIQAVITAAESGKELMTVLAETDNDARDLSQFAAQVLAAPVKVTGELRSKEDSVKLFILSLWTAARQQRRREIEKKKQVLRVQAGKDPGAAEIKQLENENIEIGYDIAKLKNWETGLPILELP